MNIEKLKNIQIVCKNKKDVEDCLNNLEELGFNVKNNNENYKIIFYNECSNLFENDIRLLCTADVYFYNENFVETLKKLIKEKKEANDFEVAKDGRIIKINNWDSDKYVHILTAWIDTRFNFNRIDKEAVKYYVSTGQLFFSEKAREKAILKMEIETKLKNIAERLNNGRNIDWSDSVQEKFSIFYECKEKELNTDSNYCCKTQRVIYCLDRDFLEVAKKEIGEENLIKYFKD